MTNEKAILILDAYKNNLTNFSKTMLEEDIEAFNKAIIALREQKPRGEWEDFNDHWKCSICKCASPKYYDYCPNCGSDMRGSDDD